MHMRRFSKLVSFLVLTAFPIFCQVNIDNLLIKLNSKINEERSAAISYLGLIKCREAVKPLQDKLGKYESQENDLITDALVCIGDPSSILPILRSTPMCCNEKELEKTLSSFDCNWRIRDEIEAYFEELFSNYLILPDNEKEKNAGNLLYRIAFLNSNQNWLISVHVENNKNAQNPEARFYFRFSVKNEQDDKKAFSLPSTNDFGEYQKYFDRLNKEWKTQENMQIIIPKIETYLAELVAKINNLRKLKSKKSILDNQFFHEIMNFEKLNPNRAGQFLNKIKNDQKNDLTLRLFCLEEWLKEFGTRNYEILDDFIKKNMARITSDDLELLHSCIDIFVENKDNKVVALLVQILSDEKEDSNEEKASFLINCMDDLAELDKDKASALLRKKVSELLNKDNLDYESPGFRYLRIAGRVGITDNTDLLLEMLKKDPMTTYFALKELQRLKPAKALPVLRNFIMAHPGSIREAAETIIQIAGKDAFTQLQEITTSLLADWNKGTRGKRRIMVSMIIKADDPCGATLIWEWLDHFDERLAIKSDEFPKEKAKSKEMEANRQAYWEQEAKESNSDLIYRMIAALGRWKEKRAIDVIKRYVNDPFPVVRAYAAWAIRQIAE